MWPSGLPYYRNGVRRRRKYPPLILTLTLTLTLTLPLRYQFRDQSTRMLRVLVTGYADDIGLLAGTRCGRDAFRNNELVLKRLQAWLEWTQSMKAKPKKCISSGLRHDEPFDPKLKVWSSGGKWFPKFMGGTIHKLCQTSSCQWETRLYSQFQG